MPRLVAEPSPQSITAVKSEAGSVVSASVNLPTKELVKSTPVLAAGVRATPVTAVRGSVTIVAGVPAVGPTGGRITDTVEVLIVAGDRSAGEGHRVGHGERARAGISVRADDVVDARITGVLDDRCRRGRRAIAPVDRGREVAGGQAGGGSDDRSQRHRECADDRVRISAASDIVDRDGRTGSDRGWGNVAQVDRVEIQGVQGAGGRRGDLHSAGNARNGRCNACRIVVERVAARRWPRGIVPPPKAVADSVTLIPLGRAGDRVRRRVDVIGTARQGAVRRR